MLDPSNESRGKIKKYEELRIKIRDLIRLVTKKSDENHDRDSCYDNSCQTYFS